MHFVCFDLIVTPRCQFHHSTAMQPLIQDSPSIPTPKAPHPHQTTSACLFFRGSCHSPLWCARAHAGHFRHIIPHGRLPPPPHNPPAYPPPHTFCSIFSPPWRASIDAVCECVKATEWYCRSVGEVASSDEMLVRCIYGEPSVIVMHTPWHCSNP